MQVFRKYMNYIKDFLENTPEDIYEFSIILEDALVDEYDAMHAEQPRATEILAEETQDICASAEPGMKPEEIEKFKRELEIEYNKALKMSIKIPPVILTGGNYTTAFNALLYSISISRLNFSISSGFIPGSVQANSL